MKLNGETRRECRRAPILSLGVQKVIYDKTFDCEDDIYFTEEDAKRAEKIIKELDGMTISSAYILLDKVKKALSHTVISL